MLNRSLSHDDGGVRPWMHYAVIAGAVVVGGYFVYAAWTNDHQPLEGTWICMTPGCGYRVDRAGKLGENVPAPCPRCSKQSLVPGYACPQCKKRLILNVYRGLPPPTICPHCGAEVHYGR